LSTADTVTLYRIGSVSRLEPWTDGDEEAEPIRVALTGGVWVGKDARGEAYFYTQERSLGLGLSTAMLLGLCRLADPEHTRIVLEDHRREHRAATRERLATSVERLVRAIRAAAAVRSPLGVHVHRPAPEETLDALADYFERIADDRRPSP